MLRQTSRLTKKFQITIPHAIRKQLSLKSGDIICFKFRDGEAIINKETPLDRAFLRALEGQLTEWQSKADEKAYCAL